MRSAPLVDEGELAFVRLEEVVQTRQSFEPMYAQRVQRAHLPLALLEQIVALAELEQPQQMYSAALLVHCPPNS